MKTATPIHIRVKDERDYAQRIRRAIVVPLGRATRKAASEATSSMGAYMNIMAAFEATPIPLEQIMDLAKAQATRIEAYHWKRFEQTMRRPLGVKLLPVPRDPNNIAAMMRAAVEENVVYIKTIPGRYHQALERELLRLAYDPKREFSRDAIQRIVTDQFRSAGWNAKRIAIDQSNKMFGQLNQVRQQQVGVERYIWRTQGDDRVRDEHAALEGTVHEWNLPPMPDGHPGNGILCRCVAQPVIEEDNPLAQERYGEPTPQPVRAIPSYIDPYAPPVVPNPPPVPPL